MWPEKDTLLEMVTFLSDIENFVTGRTLNEFVNDDMFRSAVQYKLIIVGEAVTRLSKEFRKAHARIPWQKVADYRNFSIHGYHAVDWIVVWKAATINAPILKMQVRTILALELPS